MQPTAYDDKLKKMLDDYIPEQAMHERLEKADRCEGFVREIQFHIA